MAPWPFRWQLSSAFDSKVNSSNDICQCAHITPVYRRVICKCMDEIWTKGSLVIVKTPACDTQGSMWYDKVYAHWKVIRLLQCMLGKIKDKSGMVRYYAPLSHFVIWVLLPIQIICHIPWWRHQMEAFSALLAICAGNSPVPGEFPAQRPVTRSFDVFVDLRLSKQWWGRWFETLLRPLWRHRNDVELHSDLTNASYRPSVLTFCFSMSVWPVFAPL